MTRDELRAAIAQAQAQITATQADLDQHYATANAAFRWRDEYLATAEAARQAAVAADEQAAIAAAEGEAANDLVGEATATIQGLQTTLAEFKAQLDALPPDPEPPGVWDAKALTHRWRDCHGLRRQGGVDLFEARLGVQARTVLTFTNHQATLGDWGNVPPEVRAGTARWLVQWAHAPHDLRGKSPTLARLKADLADMRPAVVRVPFRRAAEALGEHGPDILDRTILRGPISEENSWWEPGGYLLTTFRDTLGNLDQLEHDMADAKREMTELAMQIFAEVLGPDYKRIAWAQNLAGTTFMPRAQELALRAAVKDMPTGTRRGVTFDQYSDGPQSVKQLEGTCTAVDELIGEIPDVAFVGVDEWGPNYRVGTATSVLDSLVDDNARFVRTLMGWARRHADGTSPVGLSHVCCYESVMSTTKATHVVMCDRTQVSRGVETTVVLKGRENATYRAVNGQLVKANNPEMATEYIRLVAA